MDNVDFKPNPKKMSTEELVSLKEYLELDKDKFKNDIEEIETVLEQRAKNN